MENQDNQIEEGLTSEKVSVNLNDPINENVSKTPFSYKWIGLFVLVLIIVAGIFVLEQGKDVVDVDSESVAGEDVVNPSVTEVRTLSVNYFNLKDSFGEFRDNYYRPKSLSKYSFPGFGNSMEIPLYDSTYSSKVVLAHKQDNPNNRSAEVTDFSIYYLDEALQAPFFEAEGIVSHTMNDKVLTLSSGGNVYIIDTETHSGLEASLFSGVHSPYTVLENGKRVVYGLSHSCVVINEEQLAGLEEEDKNYTFRNPEVGECSLYRLDVESGKEGLVTDDFIMTIEDTHPTPFPSISIESIQGPNIYFKGVHSSSGSPGFEIYSYNLNSGVFKHEDSLNWDMWDEEVMFSFCAVGDMTEKEINDCIESEKNRRQAYREGVVKYKVSPFDTCPLDIYEKEVGLLTTLRGGVNKIAGCISYPDLASIENRASSFLNVEVIIDEYSPEFKLHLGKEEIAFVNISGKGVDDPEYKQCESIAECRELVGFSWKGDFNYNDFTSITPLVTKAKIISLNDGKGRVALIPLRASSYNYDIQFSTNQQYLLVSKNTGDGAKSAELIELPPYALVYEVAYDETIQAAVVKMGLTEYDRDNNSTWIEKEVSYPLSSI